MNLRSITATRPRAWLLGIAAGLLLGLGAVQGVVAIADAVNPGHENAPASESEKGGTPQLPGAAVANGTATRPAL